MLSHLFCFLWIYQILFGLDNIYIRGVGGVVGVVGVGGGVVGVGGVGVFCQTNP